MGCFGCWGFCRCFSCGLFFLPGNEFFWCWVQAGIACFWFSRVFESLVSERVIDPQLLQLCLLWKWFWKGSSFLWVGCTRLVVVGEGEEEKQEAASQMALILEKVKIVRNGDGKIVSCFCFLIPRPKLRLFLLFLFLFLFFCAATKHKNLSLMVTDVAEAFSIFVTFRGAF